MRSFIMPGLLVHLELESNVGTESYLLKYDNNTKYFKGNCVLDIDQNYSSIYFLKVAFVKEISPK